MSVNIQENNNLTASITTEVNGQEVNAINTSVTLNSNKTTLMLNVNIFNLDATTQNAPDVQTQFDSFINQVKTKMTDMGYPIVLK